MRITRKDQRSLLIAILALLCGICCPALAQQSLPAPLEKLFATGVEALKKGDADAAEKAFLAVLRRGGKVSFVHHNLGIVYQQRGEHARAVTQFRQAIRLQPNYGPSHLLAGSSLLAMGRHAEAARELERAVKLMPVEPQARLQLARAYERSNNLLGAVEQYQALAEMAPQEAEYAYQLGRAYNRLAEWSYLEIVRLNPNSARLHQSLGQQYLAQGKTELAALSYQKAAEADPQLPEIHLALALIFLELKRFDEASREIELELKLVPESKKAQEVKQQIAAARAASQQ
jgi:tetratricopeptide (TPR) repeat protein